MYIQLSSKKESGNVYHVVMEITDVTIEDAGKYRVVAKNELGESNASISLNFDSEYTVEKHCSKYYFTLLTSLPSLPDFFDVMSVSDCLIFPTPFSNLEVLTNIIMSPPLPLISSLYTLSLFLPQNHPFIFFRLKSLCNCCLR